MKKSKMSGRDIFMIILLVVILGGIGYYVGFYSPMQKEMANIAAQSDAIDTQIASVSGKIARMDVMQAELDEIFSRPADEITEIAPYDNKEVVLNQLNGILQASEEYTLNFAEPIIGSDGTVRRNVSMNFTCRDYASAKTIIDSLNRSQWRCMVSNLALSGGDIMDAQVLVSATITFFESTNLT